MLRRDCPTTESSAALQRQGLSVRRILRRGHLGTLPRVAKTAQRGMKTVAEWIGGSNERNLVSEQFVNWPKIRFTRAGYSCPAPGQVTNAARKLIAGCGRLVFAGEHTSMAYFGYMEGALESGLRAAYCALRTNSRSAKAVDR
jgi:monoamine oxidase